MAVQHFTTESFENDVLKAKGPVLVDFWASWCGPCKMLSPVIEELADELDGKAIVGKVNIDEQRMLATRFDILSIPTIIVFRDGKIVARMSGVQPKQTLLDAIL